MLGKLNIVKLNIGGDKFITTLATLQRVPDTFFSALCDRLRAGSEVVDDEGYVFIDRAHSIGIWDCCRMMDAI